MTQQQKDFILLFISLLNLLSGILVYIFMDGTTSLILGTSLIFICIGMLCFIKCKKSAEYNKIFIDISTTRV